METQGRKMRPFSQFVRIFVDWVREKSTIKREQMEKKSAGLAHLGAEWVTEGGRITTDGQIMFVLAC